MKQGSILDGKVYELPEEETLTLAADPAVQYMAKDELNKLITSVRKKMQEASKTMDFMTAAQLRDEMLELKKILKERFGD